MSYLYFYVPCFGMPAFHFCIEMGESEREGEFYSFQVILFSDIFAFSDCLRAHSLFIIDFFHIERFCSKIWVLYSVFLLRSPLLIWLHRTWFIANIQKFLKLLFLVNFYFACCLPINIRLNTFKNFSNKRPCKYS